MIGEQDVAPCGENGQLVVRRARTAPGSATNPSGSPRRLPRYQYRAADAWPLIGSGQDLADVRGRLPCGEAEHGRAGASHRGSICENRRARPSRQAAGVVRGALGG